MTGRKCRAYRTISYKRQGKPPLYFVACYYAQYKMRSAILRNHLKYLGVLIDENLSWKHNILQIASVKNKYNGVVLLLG